LTAAIAALVLLSDEGEIALGKGKKPVKYQLSLLVKLAALRERQVYLRAWLDQRIAPGLQDPKEKIDALFAHISALENVPKSIKDKGNVEQHEYYTLIKQYGSISEKVRTFCLLVTVAGYQAIPFRSEADGRVIVRIPATDTWLQYDVKNKKARKDVAGIELSDEVKNGIRAIDTWIEKVLRRRYTRGDRNILGYRISFEAERKVFGAACISAVTNEKIEASETCT
jgi:hypothetical protein